MKLTASFVRLQWNSCRWSVGKSVLEEEFPCKVLPPGCPAVASGALPRIHSTEESLSNTLNLYLLCGCCSVAVPDL